MLHSAKLARKGEEFEWCPRDLVIPGPGSEQVVAA
jgi:hypothetical protein